MMAEDLSADNFSGSEFKSWLAREYLFYSDCQSPIEALLGGALEVLVDHIHQTSIVLSRWYAWSIQIYCQHEIGKYRVDFGINACLNDDQEGDGILLFVIECDGHEFHEKTKEQAAKDKARDRWFAQQQIPILRFAGSEIFKDPFKCAHEAMILIEHMVKTGQIDQALHQLAEAKKCHA